MKVAINNGINIERPNHNKKILLIKIIILFMFGSLGYRFIVSVVSDMFIVVGVRCDICVPMDRIVSTTMFIIIAYVAYLFGAFLMNFFVPTDMAQMPKISAKINVSNTDRMLKIKPDNIVISAYTAIVVD
jgi:hypothetical protein